MKRSLTAVIALAAAAGFAGVAQAQTTTTPTSTPSSTAPTAQTSAPSYQSPSTAANPSAAQANPSTRPGAAPQASMQQPAGGNSFWSHNLTQNEVQQAQQQLQAQGLYRGPIDGKVGSEMHRALARFQQQNGLRQTGTLDERTMARLEGGTPAVGSTVAPRGTSATNPYAAPSSSTAAPLGAGGTTGNRTSAAPNNYGTQPTTR